MNILIKSSNGITQVSADSKLMSQRKVFIEGEINAEIAWYFCEKQKNVLNKFRNWYILMSIKNGTPKTDRKMMKFRIFCELLAKTMLESIDFTDVLEGYRRNEKPKRQGIATLLKNLFSESFSLVEMKSPRDRALQHLTLYMISCMISV